MTNPLLKSGTWCMPSAPDAILLCGGAGLRLRGVIGDTPKGMADVAGRPFLELLLRQLRRSHIERVILAVGYRRETIHSYFGERAFGLSLEYSAESAPLGTGGALRNAASLVTSQSVLIMNGDSYTDVNLREFVNDHIASKAEASLVVVPVESRSDCGTADVDPSGRLAGFVEKQSDANARYTNAGIYMTSLRLLYDIPDGQVSLEREVFPRWLREGRYFRAFIWPGTCVDIGTPERYWNAQALLENAEMQESASQCRGQR
jgi:mannose-1-phosphate guanylyltransferase